MKLNGIPDLHTLLAFQYIPTEPDWYEEKLEATDLPISCPSWNFGLLQDTSIRKFIGKMSFVEMLAFSKTSKTMYNLCDSNLILEGIAEKQGCNLNPKLLIKNQIKNNYQNYLNLFSAENASYDILSSQIQYFMREKYTSYWVPRGMQGPGEYSKYFKYNKYFFSIGAKEFETFVSSWVGSILTNEPRENNVKFVKEDDCFFACSLFTLPGIDLKAPISMWIKEIRTTND